MSYTVQFPRTRKWKLENPLRTVTIAVSRDGATTMGITAGNIKLHENPAAHFRRMEKRDWWLWVNAVAVTLILTAGIVSFLLSGLNLLPGLVESDGGSAAALLSPDMIRGLCGVTLIFDIYTLYQQLQIQTMRRILLQREELFRLIS
jgi:hypothetical protein